MTVLVDALAGLRGRLDDLRLPLGLGDAATAERERLALRGQLDDYVLPRLQTIDAPLLVVVGGSTGAGKSTLVNSLVGADVTRPGVLRPTTRAPVLVCSPQDESWFSGSRVLPGLARTTGDAPDARTLRLVLAPSLHTGLALLDAPDIDSVVTANRQLAGQLLAAADLWLFVTTAARYADAVPWDLLGQAAQRSTALALVLDRVPADAVADVAAHLGEMLERNGLAGTPVFPVPEVELVEGRLPDQVVAPVRSWLDSLAADADRRAAVVRRTLTGALQSLPQRVESVAVAADRQAASRERLEEAVRAAYAGALDTVEESVRAGSMLRGEVLARWQEYVGTGEFMRTLESRIGQLRDRAWAAITGRRPEREVQQSLESSVEDVVAAAADRAAERAVATWRDDPAGRTLLGADEAALSRTSAGFRDRLGAQVREWQGGVLRLVAEEGADKRTAARVASFGINGAGLAVMLGVFAHTGGLTGGEIAVAGGTTVAGQRVLEAVFGDEAVRRLAARARTDLIARVRALLDAEAARFDTVASAAGIADGSALRAAARHVVEARQAVGW